MKPYSRARLAPEALRAALIELGLKEEPRAVAGYAFTHYKHPDHAMSFYKDTHGGTVARRFYVTQRTYILSA